MEGIKPTEINYDNHINKCRICFKSFADEERWIEINKTTEKRFFQITQTNLKISPQVSKKICVVCNFQLATFSHAKINIIKAQKGLNKYLTSKPKTKSPTKPTKVDENQTPEPQQLDDQSIQVEEIIEEHLIDDENFQTISFQIVESRAPSSPNLSDIQKWNCHECQKSFSGGSSLTNHIAIYHSSSAIELPCPVLDCDKKCKTKKQLTQHLKTHSEDKQVCPECGLVVGNKHNLTKHIRRLHLKIYNFYCDLCDYKGFFKFNIDQHMKKHLDKSEREKFYCDECPFESISKMSLRTHKRMEHMGQKRSYLCHCGKTFTQSSSYYTHVKVVHQKIKNHSCPYAECSKTFSEKSQLKNHIKSQHLKKRDIPCSVCGKLFSTQKHLAAHIKYHKPPSFVCQYENCNNSFFTSTQLNSHYKVHNNQRDFGCQLCEKKYFHRSHLKKHILTHSSSSATKVDILR